MTLEEIKVRRLTNQHLITKNSYMTVLRELCGVQAQYMSMAVHALKIRSFDFDECNLSELIKSWTIRGTVHIFAKDDLPLFLHNGRTRYLRPCDTLDADEYISKGRKAYFADLIVRCVRDGITARKELKDICAANGMTEKESESVFNSWGGTIRALCENGTLCHIVQEEKAFAICPVFEPMEDNAARLEMTRRYFSHFGPATLRDASYFFGTTQAQIKKLIAKLPVKSVECDRETYYFIDTGKTYQNEIPECLFLAGFDQLMLGYRKEDNPFLTSEHRRKIFNLAGIVNPAVLLRGRVVGKWKKSGRSLSITLFEDLSPSDTVLIRNEAENVWQDITKLEIS